MAPPLARCRQDCACRHAGRPRVRGTVLPERRVVGAPRAQLRVRQRAVYPHRPADCVRRRGETGSPAPFLQRARLQLLPSHRTSARAAAVLGRLGRLPVSRRGAAVGHGLCGGRRNRVERALDRRASCHRARPGLAAHGDDLSRARMARASPQRRGPAGRRTPHRSRRDGGRRLTALRRRPRLRAAGRRAQAGRRRDRPCHAPRARSRPAGVARGNRAAARATRAAGTAGCCGSERSPRRSDTPGRTPDA